MSTHVRYSISATRACKILYICNKRNTHIRSQWFIYNFGLMGPGTRCFPYQWVPTANLWVQNTVFNDKSAKLLHPGTRWNKNFASQRQNYAQKMQDSQVTKSLKILFICNKRSTHVRSSIYVWSYQNVSKFLTLCMLGNFSCFYWHLLTFSKLTLEEKNSRKLSECLCILI